MFVRCTRGSGTASCGNDTNGSLGETRVRHGSVRPNKSDDLPKMNFSLEPGDWYVPNGGNFIASNLPLIRYIDFAEKITASYTRRSPNSCPPG